ncbi:hypothetical protein P4O66_017042 [Electrophorus voltai]|uniref:RETREG1-3/ARL6IP-like N-terminal reticulon-homology domain-containing protein n=1 Tax=Electrophorus voltai TaxID=2609070 RepID=A0AAD9DLQ2_9TELE|nr:hypothetical protein P4O66_017042 [Electrophorus voltai]
MDVSCTIAGLHGNCHTGLGQSRDNGVPDCFRQNNNKTDSSWRRTCGIATCTPSVSMASIADAPEAGRSETAAGMRCPRVENSGGAMAEKEEQAGGAGLPLVASLLRRVEKMINWKRPLKTSALFAATNTVFCSVLKAFEMLAEDSSLGLRLHMIIWVPHRSLTTCSTTCWASSLLESHDSGALFSHHSWQIVDSSQEDESGKEPQLTGSWLSFKLLLEETSSFKQQNPGKFCLLVCSLCSFLAVLGRYIPGVVISYIIVLGIFLWPFLSSHEFGVWLEPVLQKLTFGVGNLVQKIKKNHEKRLLQAQTERESIEADLSSLFPKNKTGTDSSTLLQLDSTACRELSVSDTEVSEVTWTDNGTFNLSEGHTPQTENSEELDRRSEEEVFSGGLPDFPSLDNGLGTNGDDDDDLSIGLPGPLLHTGEAQRGAHTEGYMVAQALGLVQRTAGDVIAAAVASAVQEHLEASAAPALARALAAAADTDSEAEEFELLDQAELEQLGGEMGLEKADNEAQPEGSKPAGFFSKLLRRP